MDLHTHRSGRGGGDDTVVFIHGFPFNGTLWRPQLEGLPAGWRGWPPTSVDSASPRSGPLTRRSLPAGTWTAPWPEPTSRFSPWTGSRTTWRP
jgi:hypothetical protein